MAGEKKHVDISSCVLLLTAAAFAVCRRQEAFVAQAAIRAGEVLTAAVGTDAGFVTFIDVCGDTNQWMMDFENGTQFIFPLAVIISRIMAYSRQSQT